MKWLQWATVDLEKNLGGVETHAQCIAAELRKLGVEVHFSTRPEDLAKPEWDVVHTHGSSVSLRALRLLPKPGPFHIHTLHGTTLGRMAACGEWFWLGGYAAAWREFVATCRANLVAAVHEDLHLFSLARFMGTPTFVCSNGWDIEGESPAPKLPSRFWVYIGRGEDHVKNTSGLIKILNRHPDLQLVTIPGGGFFENPQIFQTGILSRKQIRGVLQKSTGLVLTSRYEGLPLVVLEALGAGTPVVSTSVGGMKNLSSELMGLVRVPSVNDIGTAMKTIDELHLTQDQRKLQAVHNQKLLFSWAQIARNLLTTVERLKKSTAV